MEELHRGRVEEVARVAGIRVWQIVGEEINEKGKGKVYMSEFREELNEIWKVLEAIGVANWLALEFK